MYLFGVFLDFSNLRLAADRATRFPHGNISRKCWIRDSYKFGSCDAHWLEVEHVAAWSAAFVFTPLSVACNVLGTHDFQVLAFKPYDFITVGCASFLALCMQTAGFQLVAASIGTMMWYVQVPFGFFLQWALFDHAPSVLSICGSFIVVCAALLNLAGPASDGHQHEEQTQVTCQLKGVDNEMLLPPEAGE